MSKKIPADIANRQVVIDVGTLPETLESTLLTGRTNGILGNQAWHDRTVQYSPTHQALYFDATLQT